jgi:hypothetical protein
LNTLYSLSISPALLANLWDVTDKDIDKLALDLFTRVGIQSTLDDHLTEDAASSSSSTLTGALALARSACQLKYLNGEHHHFLSLSHRFLLFFFSLEGYPKSKGTFLAMESEGLCLAKNSAIDNTSTVFFSVFVRRRSRCLRYPSNISSNEEQQKFIEY